MEPLSLKQTHELLDLSEELEQIPHPMAEELLDKFQELLAQYGYDEGTDEDLTYDTEVITYEYRKNTGLTNEGERNA